MLFKDPTVIHIYYIAFHRQVISDNKQYPNNLSIHKVCTLCFYHSIKGTVQRDGSGRKKAHSIELY